MKVKELLDFVVQITPILEHYRDKTVKQMIGDINLRCCQDSELPVTLTGKKVRQAKAKPTVQEGLSALANIPPENQVDFLNDFTAAQLKEMAGHLQIPLKSKFKKGEIIAAIVDGKVRQGALLETGQQQLKLKPELEKAAAAIPELNKEAISELLASFNKAEILAIAGHLDLKISSSYTKGNIIALIANHFSYMEVHRGMAQRPRSTRL